MSVALVKADEEERRKPVYFMSKMLANIESHYTDFERIALALRVTAKKLCPYFQAHIINVLSNYPIIAILHKPNAIGRLLKWAIKLSEFNIIYHSRSAIKGQVLANFMVELLNVSGANLFDHLWILEIDGSFKIERGRAGIVLQSSEGLLVAQTIKFSFKISNNEAILLGL